jgi:hypothetical protein
LHSFSRWPVAAEALSVSKTPFLYGVEVGWRKENHFRAGSLYQLAGRRTFVTGKVIEDDDVTGLLSPRRP